MAARYESIKIIMDRLLRSNVFSGISLESVIDYTIDFMDIVGVPALFTEKVYEGRIDNYRSALPCDFLEEIQVLIGDKLTPALYATDTFHNHMSKIGEKTKDSHTYSISNDFIFTSLDKGNLVMNYRAIIIDDDGYPLIPSDRTFLNALENYVKVKYFTLLFENGRIDTQRLQAVQQEYSWTVGQLETDMQMQSLGKAETMFNMLRSLIPRTADFERRYNRAT
jgi:hypothetical protein